jgi:signal transduction histidine kinase
MNAQVSTPIAAPASTAPSSSWAPWRMLAGLAAIIWAYIQFPDYPAGSGLAAALALAVTAAGWTGWLAYSSRGPSRPQTAFVCLTGLAGRVLLCIDPSLTVCWFTFWACVEAGAELPRPVGFGLAGTCCAILLAGRLLQHGELLGTFAAAAFVAFSLGMYRRQREQAATTAERNRIAGELHDILGHSLTALSLQVETAAAALEVSGDVGTALTHLDRAAQLTSGAREEAVAAVSAMRDGAVGLAELTERLIASCGLTAELTVNGPPRPLSAAAGMAVYRLVQECVQPCHRHPAAHRAGHGEVAHQPDLR